MGVFWFKKKKLRDCTVTVYNDTAGTVRAVLLQQYKDTTVKTPIFLEFLVPTFSTE